MRHKCDVLIIGGGVIGLATGIALLESNPKLNVAISDKEDRLGKHASGRNSGVLHAGFYYSPDSLKARFCRDGNLDLKALAKRHHLPLKEVGKVVVAKNEEERQRLEVLYERGKSNGVELQLLSVGNLQNIEPLAQSHGQFLWSPNTAIADSIAILEAMKKDFLKIGGKLFLSSETKLELHQNEVRDLTSQFDARYFINAAGAQSDRISRRIGIGKEYALLPFMGLYRSTSITNLPLQRLVYPVPHPINPFLGVHFTLTIDGRVKIGPTAIPVLGREQYSLATGWSARDLIQSASGAFSLVKGRKHNFGSIIKSEWTNFFLSKMVQRAESMVPNVKKVNKWEKKPPGIRAQLVKKSDGSLEQDFVVKTLSNSLHVLNLVSPGWTSSIPLGRFLAQKVIDSV